MNALVRRFPEIYRCLLTECTLSRVAVGAGTSLVLGAAFWSAAAWDDKDPGKALFHYAFWTQVMTFIVYGSIRASASIADEREAKTWDLQRLTPLTSGEIAAGKLLGAPVYAAFLAALLLPWALIGGALGTQEIGAGLVFIYLQFAATAFLALSLALLASAYSELSRGGSATTAGAMIGLGSLYTLAPALSKKAALDVVYFGAAVPSALWLPAATAGFGAWAFAAAKWRVGRDLLEPPRFWRFPAFILYLILFQLGFEKASPYVALVLPAAAIVMAALAEPTTPEAWRRWLASTDWDDWISRTPSWILGAGISLVAALIITALPSAAPVNNPDPYRRLPLVLTLFLIRDTAFIQSCRFTKSRRPEIMATVFLGIAYLVPLILLSTANLRAARFAFMPIVGRDISAWLNLIPGLIGALASVSALAFVAGRSTSTSR
jgi:hypothetical protein